VTEPKKEDGTMQLDVGQIDLLDLPLPPSSKRSIDEPETHVSKGPPPLPPSLPPATAEEPKVPVPSLPPPPEPTPVPPPAISARKLVGEAPSGSPITRFLVGMGAASLLCVGGFFAIRSLHKTPKAPPAPSAEPAPAHAFTMAPVEITDTPGSASAAASSSAAPAITATATATATATTHATAAPHASHATSSKPPDDVIKVEN
jgi:hypothetical protein